MEYTQAQMGRIFLLKFSDGDDMHRALQKFVKKERVESAILFFIGALKRGHLVTGPKKAQIPPEPHWVSFQDGWETMGVGTIFKGEKGAKTHIHVSMGKKDRVMTGCLRKSSEVFLVIEAIVFELNGLRAGKDMDAKTGLELLRIYPPLHAKSRTRS